MSLMLIIVSESLFILSEIRELETYFTASYRYCFKYFHFLEKAA